MPIVLERFSTATTTIGGWNEAWLTQLAVMPCSSPSCLTVRACRPQAKCSRTPCIAASFMSAILHARLSLSHGDTHATRATGRQGTFQGRPARYVPVDAPVAAPRRQGDPAQAPEQDLLPDFRSGPRSGPGRRCPRSEERRVGKE